MVASGVLENIVEKMIANNFDTGLEAAHSGPENLKTPGKKTREIK